MTMNELIIYSYILTPLLIAFILFGRWYIGNDIKSSDITLSVFGAITAPASLIFILVIGSSMVVAYIYKYTFGKIPTITGRNK